MDFWVFAAAAGAGCVAKYWQNAFRGRVLSSKLSSDAYNHGDFQSWTSLNSPAPRKHVVEDSCNSERDVGWKVSNFSSAGEVASSSGAEEQENIDRSDKTDAFPLLALPTETSTPELCIENDCRCGSSTDERSCSLGNECGERVGGKLTSCHGLAKIKKSFRSNYACAKYIKPMNSLESCLMAQLQGLHTEMEDCLLTPFPSPAFSPIRPLVVTNGHQMTGSLTDGYLRTQDGTESHKLHKKAFSEKNKIVLGVPPLPKIVYPSVTRQMDRSGKDKRIDGWSRMSNGKDLRSQAGPRDGIILFFLGISVGIISTIVANKQEVGKLKDLLKQTENLVQDLQEELEMKDLLTVKELASENYESQDTNNCSFHDTAPIRFSGEHSREDSGKYVSQEEHNGQAGETPDSISRIEAELEAELERLGLNVSASRLGKKPPNEINEGTSSTSTTHSANYAVSPRELSLRLHEVIQSRLEKRIEELELALENSQQKVRVLESASKVSRKEFLIDKPQSVASRATPTPKGNSNPQPLIMKLSGDALSAYVETYDEFMKFESEDEDSPPDLYGIKNHKDQSQENGQMNNVMTTHSSNEGGTSIYSQIRGTNEDLGLSQNNSSACITGYEGGDADDEKEKLLIRKIVDRTRRGLPMVLKAQRMLFSEDEDENLIE